MGGKDFGEDLSRKREREEGTTELSELQESSEWRARKDGSPGQAGGSIQTVVKIRHSELDSEPIFSHLKHPNLLTAFSFKKTSSSFYLEKRFSGLRSLGRLLLCFFPAVFRRGRFRRWFLHSGHRHRPLLKSVGLSR